MRFLSGSVCLFSRLFGALCLEAGARCRSSRAARILRGCALSAIRTAQEWRCRPACAPAAAALASAAAPVELRAAFVTYPTIDLIAPAAPARPSFEWRPCAPIPVEYHSRSGTVSGRLVAISADCAFACVIVSDGPTRSAYLPGSRYAFRADRIQPVRPVPDELPALPAAPVPPVAEVIETPAPAPIVAEVVDVPPPVALAEPETAPEPTPAPEPVKVRKPRKPRAKQSPAPVAEPTPAPAPAAPVAETESVNTEVPRSTDTVCDLGEIVPVGDPEFWNGCAAMTLKRLAKESINQSRWGNGSWALLIEDKLLTDTKILCRLNDKQCDIVGTEFKKCGLEHDPKAPGHKVPWREVFPVNSAIRLKLSGRGAPGEETKSVYLESIDGQTIVVVDAKYYLLALELCGGAADIYTTGHGRPIVFCRAGEPYRAPSKTDAGHWQALLMPFANDKETGRRCGEFKRLDVVLKWKTKLGTFELSRQDWRTLRARLIQDCHAPREAAVDSRITMSGAKREQLITALNDCAGDYSALPI